jgi:predicted permease
MGQFLQVLPLLAAIFLPIAFGYLIRKIGWFTEGQTGVLRHFVIKITIPFLIFRNLFKADVSSLRQFFPAAAGLVMLTALFAFTGYLIGNRISPDRKIRNTYPLAVMAGNYAFLGWGVMYALLGPEAFTRAIFFSILFWPTFLVCGFWLIYRLERNKKRGGRQFFTILRNHATLPLISALAGVTLNLSGLSLPVPIWEFIDDFASIAIPLILFTIGLDLNLKIRFSQARIILTASVHRLIFGFLLGGAVALLLSLVFPVDRITLKVILLQSTMPSAAMSPFFADFIMMDRNLLSSIITFSTLLAMLSIPFWYAVVQLFL